MLAWPGAGVGGRPGWEKAHVMDSPEAGGQELDRWMLGAERVKVRVTGEARPHVHEDTGRPRAMGATEGEDRAECGSRKGAWGDRRWCRESQAISVPIPSQGPAEMLLRQAVGGALLIRGLGSLSLHTHARVHS